MAPFLVVVMRSCKLADIGAEGRLITDRAGHAPEQRRDFRVGLHETENVVDEEQNVLALFIAEIFRHGHAGQRDAGARAGRLVHLAVDQRGLRSTPDSSQLAIKVVALARALADAGEHRHAAVLLGDVVDQLLDGDGLADAGAAEQSDFAAARVWANEVDHLDAGFQDLDFGALLVERRRIAMNRHPCEPLIGPASSTGLPGDVHQAAQRARSHRHRIGAPVLRHLHPAHQPVGGIHRDTADGVLAEMLRDFEHQVTRSIADARDCSPAAR